ncbi:MAG TPA: hypothetical protein DDY65_03000 [Ruminococcaceae bacterium]|jgi:stage III sporulation protein AG|nr:hypothetical protein [Oscillospiraceae bacterium]
MVKLGGFIEKLGKGGWRRLVLIAGIAAIVLLFLSTLTPQSEPQTVQQYTAEETAKLERELERRLTELLAEIDGVSSPQVMVTLDRTSERVFAEESKTRSGSGENSTESTLALSGSGKEALETSVILPKVRGVAVVCGGAEDIVIREKVVNTAARVLDIKVSQVYVTS